MPQFKKIKNVKSSHFFVFCRICVITFLPFNTQVVDIKQLANTMVAAVLTEIHCKATTPPYLASSPFDSSYKSQMTLYVPKGCSDAYNSSEWKYYFSSIVEE